MASDTETVHSSLGFWDDTVSWIFSFPSGYSFISILHLISLPIPKVPKATLSSSYLCLRPTTPISHSSQLQGLTLLTAGKHLHQDSSVALKLNHVQVYFSAVPNANKTSHHFLLTLLPFSQLSTSTALRILDFSMSLHVLTYFTSNHQVFGIIPSHPLPLPLPISELFLTKTCYHFSIFLLASQNPMGLSRSASMILSPTITPSLCFSATLTPSSVL